MTPTVTGGGSRGSSRLTPDGAHTLRSQNLLHRPSFRELVDQFVHIADVSHEGVFDVFNAVSANDAGDFGGVGAHVRRLRKKRLEVDLRGNLFLQPTRVIAR